MEKANKRFKDLIDEFVNYEQTVRALLAFAALVVHDGRSQRPQAHFGFGRNMTTSSGKAITPDLVAQKNPRYGVIVEAKRTLGAEQQHWRDHLTRLKEYDSKLDGWWTENGTVKSANAILLVHQSRSRAFVRFTESAILAEASVFGSSSCIVEFNESTERVIYYHFRREYGGVSDAELSSKLDDGVQVPIEKVIESFSNVQYYDSKPPLLLILVNLWSDHFPSLMEDSCFDEEARVRKIRVRVQQIVEEIQRARGSGALEGGPRAREFPTKAAIEEALQWLNRHKLAERAVDEDGAYLVLYKKFKKDIKEHFAALISKDKDTGKHNPQQLPLFEEAR